MHIEPEIELTFVFVILMHHLHIAVKVKRSVFSLVSMRYEILLIWTDIGFQVLHFHKQLNAETWLD